MNHEHKFTKIIYISKYIEGKFLEYQYERFFFDKA